MREIKFNAWIKAHKVMVPVDFIDFMDSEITIIDDTGIQRYFPFEEVELIQYTGLQDKHGKEIYESDIIEFSRGDDWRENEQKQGISEVVYSEQITAFAYHYKAKSSWGTSYDDVVCAIGNITDQCGDLEIIGNIYENPELLEGIINE